MGLLTKVVMIILLALFAYYAYNNIKVGIITVCSSSLRNELDIYCNQDFDCVNNIKGSYPETPMYEFMLTEVSHCESNKCFINKFEFRDDCYPGETPLVYKVTPREMIENKLIGG